ncbi:MFS transporter [Candidatus Woesearchaeota archaeon]|nr:MAG: MFS transporter [Candidatus Woesearchaeota archaeon]
MYDGIFSYAMSTLTGGPLFIAFILSIGASNTLVGIITGFSFLSQLSQIPAIFLVEKTGKRKLISFSASATSRLLWIVIALTPFIFLGNLTFLAITFLVASSIANVSTCSWNSWMRDLIPMNTRGRFFAKRLKISFISGMILGIFGGFFIDYWRKNYPQHELYGYSSLFMFGALIGLISLYFISRIPEPPMEKKNEYLKILIQPFRDRNFRKLVIAIGLWSFAVNMASPFFTVYMLKILNISVSQIMILTVISQLSNIYFLGTLGNLSDKYGNKPVLTVSSSIFIICILAWTFTTLPQKHLLSLPLLVIIHVLMGLSMAGTNLTIGNIAAKLSNPKNATTYLASISVINSIFSGIAAIIGGQTSDFFIKRELAFTLQWKEPNKELSVPILDFHGFDFHFLLASTIGFISIHQLNRVKEVGEAPTEKVMHEVVNEVKRDLKYLTAIWKTNRKIPQVFQPITYLMKERNPREKIYPTQHPNFTHNNIPQEN